MAEQSEIIGNCAKNFSITTEKMHKIRWGLPLFSEIPYNTKKFSPDFNITVSCKCCISLRKFNNGLHLCIRNKTDRNITMERKVVLYDSNNKILHQERNGTIFLLEKDIDVHLIGNVDRRAFQDLPGNTLIIDLLVYITHTGTIIICNTDPEKKLTEDFKMMFENPINSDISLKIGKEKILAHWSVLCSRSPYFKRMFDSGMQESVQNSVTITDLSLSTVKKLVHFLYTADFVQEDDFQELFDLYYAADKYEVMDLRALCGDRILSNATADNVCEIFQLSRRHNDKALKREAIDFIRTHSDAVFQTKSWKMFEASDPETAELISFFTS